MRTERAQYAIIATVVLIAGFTVFGQRFGRAPAPSSGGVLEGGAYAAYAQQQAIYAQQAQQQAQQDAIKGEIAATQQATLQRIYSKDVWRVINGTTNYAGGKGWAQIQGIFLENRDEGMIFNGAWGPLLSIKVEALPVFGENKYTLDFRGKGPVLRKFLVKHIPTDCLNYGAFLSNDNNVLTGNFCPADYKAVSEKMAFYSGNYTITNAGEIEAIPVFDYGTPCVKIWSAEELAAIKAQREAPKKEANAKALKSNQDQAAKGEAYGLLRMGERYRDGDGVPKDLAKARDYLTKAAAAGSTTAADELRALPSGQ